MKYEQKCGHCGSKKVAYTHRLNRPLVSALAELATFYDKTNRPCNLQRDLHLTKNQYNNFQKLQYFGLVRRTQGGWYPTIIAFDFLSGKGRIPDTSASMSGDALEYAHEAWKTHEKRLRMVSVNDYLETTYKRQKEYQQEHIERESLFSNAPISYGSKQND